jgi:hypothetical protein
MSVLLGRTSRAEVRLSAEERSQHMQIVGASGTGKSKLLEAMVRQDIMAGRGLCLIDPHGALVDEIVAWCASRGLDRQRRVRVIRPAEAGWSLGFNPLRSDGITEPIVRVDAMVAACAQVWGGEDMASTPRLKKTLRAIFYVLAVRGLTITEAPLLTSAGLANLRHQLTDNLPDPVFDILWQDLNGLSRREFVEVFESTNNRIGEFLTSRIVRRILGQREDTLDLRRAMDEGDILLFNLVPGSGLSADNVRLLGTLLTSEFRLCALQREVAFAKRHPFTLYIDECHDFLTSDVERMLDQTRKFGLHLVLAHQRLGQLRDRSPGIYNGVMTGGQTKVVFGGLTDEDAEIMAREVFRSSFNLERPKHVLDKPIVVDEVPYWLEAETDAEGGSHTNTTSCSYSSGGSLGEASGSAELFNVEAQVRGTTNVSSTSTGAFETMGTADAHARSDSWSSARGRAQTFKPVRQTMATAVHSLEEELHFAIVKLRELPKQAAVVKRRGRPPVRFRPSTIASPLSAPTRVSAFIERTLLATPFLAPADQVDEAMASRRRGFHPKSDSDAQAADAEFWSE